MDLGEGWHLQGAGQDTKRILQKPQCLVYSTLRQRQ